MSNKVLTVGTFDMLHTGHLYLFEQCRRIAGEGGEVVVAVNSDEFILQFKHKKPVQPYEERTAMIKALRSVDTVWPAAGADNTELLRAVNPNFLVIGSDWAADDKDYYAQMGFTPLWLQMNGTALVYLDRWSEASSTELKERVRAAS